MNNCFLTPFSIQKQNSNHITTESLLDSQANDYENFSTSNHSQSDISKFRVPSLPRYDSNSSNPPQHQKSIKILEKKSKEDRINEWVSNVNTQIDEIKSDLISEADDKDTSFSNVSTIIYEISGQKHPFKIKVPTNGMTMFWGCDII